MSREEQGVKPAVKIKCLRAQNGSDLLRFLTAGLEEQAVPWELIEVESTSIPLIELGLQAARESPLRLGVAIDEKGNIGLFHAQVTEKPLFQQDRATPAQARALGENAGRLVRRVPLKSLEEMR